MAYRSSSIVSVGGLPPTHRTVLTLVSGGQARRFAPDHVRLQMEQAINGLANKPYPKGRGETRLGSTSSSVRVRGCFSE